MITSSGWPNYGGGNHSWHWGGRMTFPGEVEYPLREAGILEGMAEIDRSAITEGWVPGRNRSGNIECSSKEVLPGGTRLNCRHWGVLRRCHLVFWVKGRTSPKRSRTGKDIAIYLLASQLMCHSPWGLLDGRSKSCRRKKFWKSRWDNASECGLWILVKYNFSFWIGVLWGNRP